MFVVIGLLALLTALDRGGLGVAPPGDLRAYDGQTARVVRVIDGDTLLVHLPDAVNGNPETRVRLWGIDAPELARPSEGRPAEPWAEASRDALVELVQGRRVRLELEPSRLRGGYGRLLAHVVLEDGRSAAGVLVDRGLAEADGRWSHDRYDDYARRERAAKAASAGLWGP